MLQSSSLKGKHHFNDEEMFRKIIENIGDMICFFNSEGKLIYTSSQCSDVLGTEPGQLKGKAIDEFMHPLDIIKYRDFLSTLPYSENRKGRIECRLKKKDGSWQWYLLNIIILEGPEKPIYAAIVFDIAYVSEIKHNRLSAYQNEEQMQQAQKMEALGTLAGGIAHDFNNILTGIVGYTELSLEDAPRDSMIYQCLLEVLKLGERAKDLVSQILSFSRKNVSKYQLLDIEKVLRETVKMLRATIPSTISIKEDYRYSPAVLYADPTEIQQLIMNLSINAEQAMMKKGGILIISLDKFVNGSGSDICFDSLKPGDYVKISVKDTGCGMNKRTMERIFEPFFTTKGVHEGTGLGLSVVHGIVTRHNGVITVDSEPGKGSTFDVFLPLAEDTLI